VEDAEEFLTDFFEAALKPIKPRNDERLEILRNCKFVLPQRVSKSEQQAREVFHQPGAKYLKQDKAEFDTLVIVHGLELAKQVWGVVDDKWEKSARASWRPSHFMPKNLDLLTGEKRFLLASRGCLS
jgi:hypothetical protein